MNRFEKELLEIEQNLRDSIQNKIEKQNTDNKKVSIENILYIGEIEVIDKISGKPRKEKLFIVQKDVKEIDNSGKVFDKKVINYYLGEKCIAVEFPEIGPVYSEEFETVEPEKIKAINKLINDMDKDKLEKTSLKILEKAEINEVITVGEEEKEEQKENKRNELDKNETEKIKVNGIQKIDLNKKADGIETLRKKLDLEEYDNIYIVYSDRVDDISNGERRNNTVYSLVGMRKDGTAKVLNDEFEMDKSVGNNASREQTKINADGTATRDNKDSSVYVRKSNGMTLGCQNDMGNIRCFLGQKTKEENEIVASEIETSKTKVISLQTRELMNTTKGMYQADKIQDEVEMHTKYEDKIDDIKDFDGNENTSTHSHYEETYIDTCVSEILNYKNENGEQVIEEVFTREEVKEKLLREIEANKENKPIELIVQEVREEMEVDAQMYNREKEQ